MLFTSFNGKIPANRNCTVDFAKTAASGGVRGRRSVLYLAAADGTQGSEVRQCSSSPIGAARRRGKPDSRWSHRLRSWRPLCELAGRGAKEDWWACGRICHLSKLCNGETFFFFSFWNALQSLGSTTNVTTQCNKRLRQTLRRWGIKWGHARRSCWKARWWTEVSHWVDLVSTLTKPRPSKMFGKTLKFNQDNILLSVTKEMNKIKYKLRICWGAKSSCKVKGQ